VVKQSAAPRTEPGFNPHTFLSTTGRGRRMVSFPKNTLIFAQGDATDGIFVVQTGRIRLNVVSEAGKEATLGILSQGDFFGEGGLAGQVVRTSSATAITDNCVLLHIEKQAMTLAMDKDPTLAAMFIKYLLKRNIRYQDDLVDQLFNSSEKRLARVLLLMAQFGQAGVSEMSVPRLSQETLAEMVGTTRPRVNFFMNRFRKLGFINYNAGDTLHVHSSLLNVLLHDDEAVPTSRQIPTSRTGKGPEPPPELGGAPEADRARKTPLPGASRRRKQTRIANIV
jgi:CRP/FNR family transcriptional regulator, cyclic AMP receptor protein